MSILNNIKFEFTRIFPSSSERNFSQIFSPVELTRPKVTGIQNVVLLLYYTFCFASGTSVTPTQISEVAIFVLERSRGW